jgi:carboxymethylenebutenolidase
MQEVVPHIMGLNAEGLTADLTATLDHLAAAGFTGKQVGIVGFCMGGTIAFFAGEKWPLGAAVTFYGGGITQGRFGLPGLFDIAPKLQTPWLGLYGDHDQSIPLTEVEILRKAASAAPVPTDVHRYGDADHGFHCTHRAQFHEPSSQDAWKRAIAWFDAHVGAN